MVYAEIVDSLKCLAAYNPRDISNLITKLELSDMSPVGRPQKVDVHKYFDNNQVYLKDGYLSDIVEKEHPNFSGNNCRVANAYYPLVLLRKKMNFNSDFFSPALIVQFYDVTEKDEPSVRKAEIVPGEEPRQYFQVVDIMDNLGAVVPGETIFKLKDLKYITPVGHPIELPGTKTNFEFLRRPLPLFIDKKSGLEANAFYLFGLPEIRKKINDKFMSFGIVQLYHIDKRVIPRSDEKTPSYRS